VFGFGIIGCGMVANIHVQAIEAIADAELIGVFDQNIQYGKQFAVERKIKAFESIQALFADEKIDIVCICTPSGLHAGLAIEALLAGKHVIVEKPMALNLQDCNRIMAAEKRSGKICAVVSQLRFSPVSEQVKKEISAGNLGKIVEIGLHMRYHRSKEYYANSAWRGTWAMDGGGALMNQGIHGVDLLISFLGLPKSVFAYCRTLHHDIEVEDTVTAVLEYENGPIGVLEATTSVYPGYPRQLGIYGTEGCIVLEENSIKKWDVKDASVSETITEQSGKNGGFQNPADISYVGHQKEFEDVIAAIKAGRRPIVDTVEGKKSIELITAIYKSSETGKKIIL